MIEITMEVEVNAEPAVVADRVLYQLASTGARIHQARVNGQPVDVTRYENVRNQLLTGEPKPAEVSEPVKPAAMKAKKARK